MSGVTFDLEMARSYTFGRRMPDVQTELWVNYFYDLLENAKKVKNQPSTGTILDLGSGIGRFSSQIAERTGVEVLGVEPSPAMLEVAKSENSHPMVRYYSGSAESIPLRRDQCDAAFLFLSLHHFTDRRAAGREICRVCKPDSPIMIRTEFCDRPQLVFWHHLLPRAAEIDINLYPEFEVLCADLESAGLRPARLSRLPYKAADTLKVYLSQLRLGSLSALRLYGKALAQQELDELEFHDTELNEPVYEVGHVLVCRTIP